MPEARKLKGFTTSAMGMSRDFDADYLQELTTRYNTALPTATGGWDATTILAHLGQYDPSVATDSDPSRCVQAVSLAMRILQGPAATAAFLKAVATEATSLPVPAQPARDTSAGATPGTAPTMTPADYTRTWTERRAAVTTILNTIADRITSGQAKYGHLWWAMEAAHDAVDLDDAGTPVTEEPGRLFPAGSATSLHFERLNVWTTDPGTVVTRMSTLGDHDMLVLHTWTVAFNTMFDRIIDSGQQPESPNRTHVTIGDPGGPSRSVVINRISTRTKPAASAINDDRDTKSGHILLAFRDGGSRLLYEPEVRAVDDLTTGHRVKPTGRQLFRLDADILKDYLKDQASFGMFGYLQIFGKVKRDDG